MNYSDSWVDNRGTAIHFVDVNNTIKENVPLIIIPGLSESAEDYISLMERFSPRRCVAITLRGRGKSDTPETGYTLEDHISDIDTVINHLALKEFILLGYSRGVSYAIGYAIKYTKNLKGLIICDYPANHTQLRQGWVEFFSSLPPWRGKPLSERMNLQALHGLQSESTQVSFWDDLPSITCPTLIIRGGKEGALISLETAKQYVEKMPQADVAVFVDSDHNIFEPNVETFIETTNLFLKDIK
ncbi:alpha/beta fold hydrolase [Brevibacillus daliensis]|uniref:alpha/beta fold hydrolase n=1 Tax=Brevibacillus daliensis TaxID=2892995 RepID=UPI001E62318D|nr:alpha/beta hydrolase [Brevibacillus daliensis]